MRSLVIVSLLFTVVTTVQADQRAVDTAKINKTGFPNTLGPDQHFFKINSKQNPAIPRTLISNPSAESTDCRAHIQKVVCLVEPVGDHESAEKRNCLPGSQRYALFFEQLYDNYPPVLQKMFCSLAHLYIEKEFFGTAYAGSVKNADGEEEPVMGIRQSVLDQHLNLTTWATWKEQLSFGGVAADYTITPNLPQITTTSNQGVNDFLYFVVTHEFGHIFDFANDLNKVTTNCGTRSEDNGDSDCTFARNTWGTISWKSDTRVRTTQDFAGRSGLCFYMCEQGTLALTAIPGVYEGLWRSNFISTYASTNPWDDFADSLAYYMMDKNLGVRYTIDTRQGETYDIIAKMKSRVFLRKLKYIEQFLGRTDIKYP